jgi:hypothetical protein
MVEERSICHQRIVDEAHDATCKRWWRRHLGRNLRGECHEGCCHPTVVPPLSETRTAMVVLPHTIDSTSDLIHFYIESPINAIGMRVSRTVGAGAAENGWSAYSFDGGGSKDVAAM